MKAKSIILALLFTVLLPMTASGIIIETLPGTTVGGQPVDVTAEFNFAGGFLTSIELVNNISNPISVIQNLNGIGFVLTGGDTTGTLSSSSAQFVTVAANGTGSVSGPSATGWQLVNNWGGTGLLLTAVGTVAWPEQTLIGQPVSGNYPAANGSIAGNAPHNPFIYGNNSAPAIFNLTGISGTGIQSATFFFGTGSDSVSVPEPATLYMMILALGPGLAVILGIRRKTNKG